MKLRYSSHLALRLKTRGIPSGLPRKVYLRARQRFFDYETGLEIAVYKTKLFGKRRDVMLAYRRHGNFVLLITIHPLKRHQIQNRVHSNRWGRRYL